MNHIDPANAEAWLTESQLSAYLARIGYAGLRAPTLDVLHKVVLAHACRIPFENLDVLLGARIDLRMERVHEKLVAHGRGGYCFEQNTLLMAALRTMGFAVRPLSGRVRFQLVRGIVTPRTHVFLRCEIDGCVWLVDVGVGGITPTAPLRFEPGLAQATAHETHRVVAEEARYFHQALIGEQWADVYEFTGEQMAPIDREVANWWTSTSADSKFRRNLIVAIACEDGTRRAIQNRRFTRRRGATVLESFDIGDTDDLLRVLATEFGLRLASGTRLRSPPEGCDWPH
jgi:N-hydroxyarylamine O-acetyltransferase